jgi:MYXO-CTERM domain-containing protein
MRCAVSILTVVALTGLASADLVNPDVPTWRGDFGASYAEFDTFTQAFAAPNFADIGGGGFSLTNNGAPGTATIASSGNIYGFGGPLDISMSSLGPVNTPTQAVLNISWGGNMLDTGEGDVQALFNGTYYNAVTELRDSEESPFGGTVDTWAFTFDLTGAVGFGTLEFFFGNDLANGSLDAVSVDVLASPIPAPGALALLGLAGVARRRRRG